MHKHNYRGKRLKTHKKNYQVGGIAGPQIPVGAKQLEQMGQVGYPLYPGSTIEGDVIDPTKLQARNDYMGSTKSVSDFYYLNPLTSPSSTSPKASFPMRKWRAENLFGIPNYRGTAAQNSQLLKMEQSDWNSPSQYQVGGVIGTPEQRAEANLTAQRLAAKLQLVDAPNMQIGEFLPEYVDPSGRPAQPLPSRQLPTRLPSHIRPEDVQQEQGVYYFIDPRDDRFVELDAATFRGRQFQKPIEQVNIDQAGRNVALRTQNMQLGFKYGGRKQRGGLAYDQSQKDQALNNLRMLAPRTPLTEEDIIPGVNAPYESQYSQSPVLNPIQEGIQKGIFETPKGYDSVQQAYTNFNQPNVPSSSPNLDNDWMTPLGIGLMGSRGVLSELSGRVARKRQDNYDATQQRLFNNKGEVNLNDYQPSPYSLYAKYGGKLRNYMPKFNNNAQMRMDRRMGGKMVHGGNPAMAAYHDLPMDDYNMIMMQQQQQVPEGFHLMPDGRLIPDNQIYRGGGLSRDKNYGSKKKPYPSVKSSDFAGGNRSYPIPTKADAIDALRLAGLHGRSDVRAKVYKKYPELRK